MENQLDNIVQQIIQNHTTNYTKSYNKLYEIVQQIIRHLDFILKAKIEYIFNKKHFTILELGTTVQFYRGVQLKFWNKSCKCVFHGLHFKSRK